MQQAPVDCSEIGIQLDEALEMLRGKAVEKEPTRPSAPTAEDRFKVSPKPARERRNWKRFAAGGTFVAVAKDSILSVLKPSHVKLGPLKDIGMKGLAVHYGEKATQLLKKADHLSILSPEGHIVVERIPFKVVNNFKVADLPGGKEVWSLCVSFGRLLPTQKSRIEAFIEDYGDEVPSAEAGQIAGTEA